MKIKYLLVLILITVIACAGPKPRKPVNHKSSASMEGSVDYNKKLIINEEGILKNIMENDSLNHYHASSLGFWYSYNHKSANNEHAKEGDALTFTYEVRNTDYELIYSTQEIGEQTYILDKQEQVEGLRNGLKLMSEGDIITFLFPSHKMYGYIGDQHKIGINQPLIIKVKLFKIKRENEDN